MQRNVNEVIRTRQALLSWLMHFTNSNSPLRLAMQSYQFWLLAGMLAFAGVLHCQNLFTQPMGQLPFNLTGHSLERILFLLPVIYGGFVFGVGGGVITLSIAALIMLLRVIYASPNPPDALIEVTAVTLVAGTVLVWLGGMERERSERQEGLVKLEAARQELASHVDIIKRNERILATINEVCGVVNQSLELPDIVHQILSKVKEVAGAKASLLFLVDEKTQEFELSAQIGLPDESDHTGIRFRIGEGCVGGVARSGEPVLIDDVKEDAKLFAVFAESEISKFMLIVPLKSKGFIIGCICVVRNTAPPFSPEDVRLLTAICEQIGIGIENAHLYQEVRTSGQKYRDIFENALVAIFFHDLEGNILEANKACAKLTGYKYEELIGMNIARLESSVTGKMAAEMEERLLRGEVVAQPYDIRLVKKDGTECIISLTTQLITEKGQIKGFQHLARDVTERRRLRESLDYYLRQLLTVQEDERKRISRELHDETGQSLLLLTQQLDQLSSNYRIGISETVRGRLRELRELVIRTLDDLKQLTQDLRPRILDDLGLVAALEWLGDSLNKQYGIQAQVQEKGSSRPLSSESQLLLFRIAQEALSNVRRHSSASMVDVTLEFSRDKTCIIIQDNGKGFKLPERLGDLAKTNKLGLLGMQERARLLGGSVTIWSAPDKGTKVTAELPV